MKDQSFSYRIVKVGGKAVAVALTALGLMASGSVYANNVFLGTSTGYGYVGDGTTSTSGKWDPSDNWVNWVNSGNNLTTVSSVTNPTASYGTATSRGGDIFYGTTVIYGDTNGNAYTDYPWGTNPVGGYFDYLEDSSPRVGINAIRQGTYIANNFGNIEDRTGNNYIFGSGTTVNDSSRGRKASATGTYWVDVNRDGGWSIAIDHGVVAGSLTTYAIDITGNAYFVGNNTINGDAQATNFWVDGNNSSFNGTVVATQAITVNGNDNAFNGAVTANKVDLVGDRTAFAGNVTVTNGLNFLNGVTASMANGADITGNVNMGGNDATLRLSDTSNINGNVTGTGTDNGSLVFEGSGVVTGQVGAIKNISVLGNQARVQLNTASGNTTVNSLNITADKAAVEVYGQLTGNVNMNGHYSKLELVNRGDQSVQTAGMNGVLDFGMYKSNQALLAPDTYGKGTLEVGTNVNVTFSDDPTAGIKLTNADNATVVFAGNSTVTGNLGSADSTKHNTPHKIYAGAGTSTVTFNGHVFVGAGNLNVGPSNTTVKLNGATGDAVALTGNLVFGTGTPVSVEGQAYTTYGDAGVNGTWGNAGTVELADGKDITGSITTVTNGTGNMKFMGSSAYANNIGTQALKLNSVVFNAAATSATSTIAGNVWASEVTIGNGTNTTTATLTAGEHQLGDKLTLAGANTTLNLLGATTTKNTDGTLSNAGTSTVTVGDNGIVTNGATLNFAVNAGNVEAHTGAIVAPTQGSLIQTTGSLTMNGNEKVNVTLLGSIRDGQTIKLIDAVSTNSNALNAATLVDNSFVIDTATSRVGGDLVMTATRADNQYIAKSETTGHFSNAAALRLGTLAANGDSTNNPGTNYTSDMQTVFNKLDLNEWGFGNNQANLAKQVKRLAPISNGSIAQSAIDAGNLALNTMGNRMASLRADKAPVGIAGAEVEGRDGQWIKLVGNNSKQNAKGDYDGYSANTSGLVWGADTRIDKDALLGLGLSATNTRVSQSGFRSGDSNSITSYEIAGYGAYQFTEEFYGEGSLSYARHNITGNRLTALDRVAKADYSANQLTGRLGIGYRFVLDDKQTLTPMLNLESSSLSSGAYTETGADALNLKLNSQKLTRTRTSLGLRYLAENTTDAGTVYRPELTAAIYRDGSGTTKETVAAFEGDLTGNTFSTTNAVLGRSGYNLAAGVSILNSKTSLVQLHLGYDHREGFSSTSARIKARWDF